MRKGGLQSHKTNHLYCEDADMSTFIKLYTLALSKLSYVIYTTTNLFLKTAILLIWYKSPVELCKERT